MLDNMHGGQQHYTKCEIRNVAYPDKLEYLSFDIYSKEGIHLNSISICNRTVKKDILNLFAHHAMRLFWAYGMVDVDVWRKDADIYTIEWSPCDGVSCRYEVSKEELQKLLMKEGV